ncbi:MAG: hypothetical protein O3C02_02525 [Cyanobacteria bacterium]|nr:hypothetical protein [Cyanobacteriota bacterium]
MQRILPTILLALTGLTSGLAEAHASSEIPESIHERCLQAKDYAGCIQANKINLSGQISAGQNDRFGLPVPANSIAHQRTDGTISYFFPDSVQAVSHKGRRDRYLTWRYTYHYQQAPTAGYWTPGKLSCSFVGSIKSCSMVGRRYVPGTPGGPRSNTWQVVGDCEDYTAKWLNDRRSWQSLRDRDFTKEKLEEANEVLESTCARINDLPVSSLKI